jgi:hypothetical protein
MIKKFISMGTAVLLMASGISVIGASSANAAPPTITSLSYLDGIQRTITGFSPSTTTYAVTANNSAVMITTAQTSGGGATAVHTCNGRVMIFQQEMCFLNSGANTWTIVVTLGGESTTYTITFNYSPPAPPANPTVSGITSSGATVDVTIIVAAAAAATVDLDLRLLPGTGSTDASAALQTIQLSRSATTVELTGLASSTNYRFVMVNRAINFTIGGAGGVVSFTTLATGSSSTPATPTLTAAEIAAAAVAAAKAAAEAAAIARAAEIATAQTALATVLKGDKAGTLSEYRSANINVTTTAALTRLNAEVLKLSAADRADFAKIKAIADKIEFDEAFFNTTARPSIATYAANGVTGVTERILTTMNAKVLELPAALRVDVKAMQELVKVESFVDRVANPVTRSTVNSAALISRGLLVAEYPRRHSVVNGLSSYPEGSLNTMAKIEAAIKEQIYKAEAPKRRLAEIKAQIAARKK